MSYPCKNALVEQSEQGLMGRSVSRVLRVSSNSVAKTHGSGCALNHRQDAGADRRGQPVPSFPS
jgi:hypothetical protein